MENTCLSKSYKILASCGGVIYYSAAARFTSKGESISTETNLPLRVRRFEHRSASLGLIKDSSPLGWSGFCAFFEQNPPSPPPPLFRSFNLSRLQQADSRVSFSLSSVRRISHLASTKERLLIAAVRLYNVMGINNTASRSNPRGMHNARIYICVCVNIYIFVYIYMYIRMSRNATCITYDI